MQLIIFMFLLVSYLVSQRATCCFAESGSAFVNCELNVPEESHIVQDGGGDTLRWLWWWACLGDCAKCNKESLHYFDPLLPVVWSFLFFCLATLSCAAHCPTLFVRFVTLSFFPVRMHPMTLSSKPPNQRKLFEPLFTIIHWPSDIKQQRHLTPILLSTGNLRVVIFAW